MHRVYSTIGASLLLVAAGCTPDSALQADEADEADVSAEDLLRIDVGAAGRLEIYGLAEPPRPESDEQPRYELFAQSRATGDSWELGIAALDAIIDDETATLAWIDTANTLWSAPADRAPDDKQEAAGGAITGLSAARGKVAFATRLGGPETAPFVYDLRAGELIALDDGPGPDEVLGFSPGGDEVLLLSGRTGLASLFTASLDQTRAEQLTNLGLSPGPDLDPAAVTPAPIHHRDVAWDRNGIAFRAEDAVMHIAPDGEVTRLSPDVSIEEAVR